MDLSGSQQDSCQVSGKAQIRHDELENNEQYPWISERGDRDEAKDTARLVQSKITFYDRNVKKNARESDRMLIHQTRIS